MRKFKNNKTGKVFKLDDSNDRHLITNLENDKDYKEMIEI